MARDDRTADLESELRAMFRRRAGDVRVADPSAVRRATDMAQPRVGGRARRPRPALVAAALALVAVVGLTVVAVSSEGPPTVGTPIDPGPPVPPVTNDAGETVRRVWDVDQDGRHFTIEQVSLPGQGDRVGINLLVDGRRVFITSQAANCVGGDPGGERTTPVAGGGYELAGSLAAGATGAELTFDDGTVTTVESIGAPGLPLRFFYVAEAPGLPSVIRPLGAAEPPSCA
jgi:hypothetical protein